MARHALATAALALLVVGAGLSGCQSDETTEPPATSTVTTTTAPAVDPSVAALQGEALRVYRGYLSAITTSNANGEIRSAELRSYLGEPLLTEVSFYMQKDFDQGEYYIGEIRPVEAKVTDMKLTATPKTMTISACVDYSTYQLVKRKDKTPVPNAKTFGRVPATVTVTQFGNGQWLVSASAASWDKTC
jgi:hypothetical protein